MARRPVTKDIDPSATVEQLLHSTDLGEILIRYKNFFIAGIALIVAAIAAYAVYSSYHRKASDEILVKIYDFSENVLSPYENSKLEDSKFNEELSKFLNAAGKNRASILTLLDIARVLETKGKKSEAIDVLVSAEKVSRSNDYIHYIVSGNLASIYENSGKTSEAIAVLEGLSEGSKKIYEAKFYLDLGRLYKNSGNKEKAKTNLEYIVSNFPDDELAKIAKIYISELI